MLYSSKKSSYVPGWVRLLLVAVLLNSLSFLFNPTTSEALAQPSPTSSKDISSELGVAAIAGFDPSHSIIEVRWKTGFTKLYYGFNIYRSTNQSGPFTKIGSRTIKGNDNPIGPNSTLNFIDNSGKPGDWYQLESIAYDGQTVSTAPIQATAVVLPALPAAATKPTQLSQPIKANLNCAAVNTNTYKFYVSANGIYRITYSDLQNTCLNLSMLTGAQAHLTGYGKSVQVATNTPGTLNSSSYLEFYAQGNNSSYTNETAYYLSFDGQGPPVVTANVAGVGSRAALRRPVGVKSSSSATPSIYQANYHYADYFAYSYTSAGDDPFAVGCVNSWYQSSKTMTFTLSSLPAGFANNTVTLTGFMEGLSGPGNVHQPSFLFNGQTVGQTPTFNGLASVPFRLTFPQSYLNVGSNTLTMQVTPDPNQTTPSDAVCLNHFDVSYVRSTVAQSDRLTATLNNAVSNVVSGFTDNHIIGYDISNPSLPQRLTLPTPTQQNGGYAITLAGSNTTGLPGRARSHTYYFATTAQTMLMSGGGPITPLQPYAPANLKANTNSYDMLIISYSGFNQDSNSPAQLLARMHNAQGQNTLVINQEDIYDIFNYGNSDPQTIKTFLSYAHSNWAKAPKWVLLLGGASPNYRNYDPNTIGVPTLNLLPTHFFLSTNDHVRLPGDNWFVTGADGLTPYMSIGRLPAQNLSEATAAVTNILNYYNAPDYTTGSWRNTAGFIADQYDENNKPTQSFTNDNQDIQNTLTALAPSLTITNFNSGQYGSAAAVFNAGVSIINYIGHGSEQEWSTGSVLTTDQIDNSNLTNGNKRPLVLHLTCFTGEFSLNPDSLAWKLQITPNGGAIASVAAPGFTYPIADVAMGKAYYQGFFTASNSRPTIGEAMQAAQATMVGLGSGYYNEVNQYMLIGDPAIYLAH